MGLRSFDFSPILFVNELKRRSDCRVFQQSLRFNRVLSSSSWKGGVVFRLFLAKSCRLSHLKVEGDVGRLRECEIATLVVFQHLAYNSIGYNPVRVE